MLRVGSIKTTNDAKDFNYPNFTNIVVMTKSSKYGELGPYLLKDEKGRIIENVWQGSKVYQNIPKSVQRYSMWDNTIIWDHPSEIHLVYSKDGSFELTKDYWNWREKLMNCNYAVRYPVGMFHRKNCLFSIQEETGEILDYIQSRKKIYFPLYSNSARKKKEYQELKNRLKKGENLLILEVDGPREESLDYYKEKYDVDDNFIDRKTVLINEESLNIFLNDLKHPFGHGYCLATILLDNSNLEKKLFK